MLDQVLEALGFFRDYVLYTANFLTLVACLTVVLFAKQFLRKCPKLSYISGNVHTPHPCGVVRSASRPWRPVPATFMHFRELLSSLKHRQPRLHGVGSCSKKYKAIKRDGFTVSFKVRGNRV